MKWNYKEDDSTMFCSEFVALAFREAGINKPEYGRTIFTHPWSDPDFSTSS